MKYLLSASLACLLFFSCGKEAPSPEMDASRSPAQERLLEELGRWAHPLSGYAAGLPEAELSPVAMLGDAAVVGLGEATHGSKPFFAMKHRLFRYLVEKHGFRGLAFEMDFAESLLFNQYISGGEGDIRNLIREKMLFWTWRTEEVLRLLEWMRQYNTGRPPEDKVRIYGIDCQRGDYHVSALLQRLRLVSPSLEERVAKKLMAYQSRDYKSLSFAEAQALHDSISIDIEAAIVSIQKFQPLIAGTTSPAEYEVIKQLAKSIRQTEYYTFLSEFQQAGDLRERCMAENTIWISRQLDGKIAVWAHNNHVGKTAYRSGGGAMGYHLWEELEEGYQAAGFTFGKGNFQAVSSQGGGLGVQAISQDPPLSSINGLFFSHEERQFLVFLEDLQQETQWAEWLQQPRPMLNIGAVYDPGSEGRSNYFDRHIARDFDVLVHFDISSPSELIR